MQKIIVRSQVKRPQRAEDGWSCTSNVASFSAQSFPEKKMGDWKPIVIKAKNVWPICYRILKETIERRKSDSCGGSQRPA